MSELVQLDAALVPAPVAPPAWAGLAGVARQDGRSALLLAAAHGPSLLLVSDVDGVAHAPRGEPAGADARAVAWTACEHPAPATLAWAAGRVPGGGSLLVGRLASADDPTTGLAVLLAHDGVADDAAAAASLVARATGAVCMTLATGDERNGPARIGALALGHAALAALATLPPAGTRLELAGVMESGAPLAVWRPRPFAASRALQRWEHGGDRGWRLGDALLESRAGDDGRLHVTVDRCSAR